MKKNRRYETIVKFIYWNSVPFIYSIIALYVIFYTEDIMETTIRFIWLLIIYVFVSGIHFYIGRKYFKNKRTLVDKIMSCKIRLQHGYNYCAVCPDGYQCPTMNVDDD